MNKFPFPTERGRGDAQHGVASLNKTSKRLQSIYSMTPHMCLLGVANGTLDSRAGLHNMCCTTCLAWSHTPVFVRSLFSLRAFPLIFASQMPLRRRLPDTCGLVKNPDMSRLTKITRLAKDTSAYLSNCIAKRIGERQRVRPGSTVI